MIFIIEIFNYLEINCEIVDFPNNSLKCENFY